ncbi:MAG: 4-hydroxy-tetrahydrodipicolinate synthase [Alphaproteobacteria bacterium]|nr:4-hydroxy-tetrahydrodipicolinate synthase [Alphaproteobacteria bacterium]
MFKGPIPALVTPFTPDGRVDEKAFQALAAWAISEGVGGIVPCGTTGESPTLSNDEHHRVVELAVEAAAGKVPVIAGTGSNSTAEAIELTRHAKKAGASAALVVTPYYNKPTQEGLYLHYKAINDAVEIPIIIYNIPGRCVIDMTVETMARLSQLPNIVGVKDATNDLGRVLKTKRACKAGFCLLSGEDGTQLPFLAQGGAGCISVTANVAPGLLSRMHAAFAKGDVATAMSINEKLMPLHEALFVETNPTPIKYAVSLLGKGRADVRLPLAPITDSAKEKVTSAMAHAGLI